MDREHARFNILGKIRSEKEKRGWSEYELAKMSELPQSTISTWYRKNLQPSVASVEKICDGLGITLAEFFNTADCAAFLSEEEAAFLSALRVLTPAQREAVLHLMRVLTDHGENP